MLSLLKKKNYFKKEICLANNVKNQGVAKIILNNFYFIYFFFLP